MGEAARRVSGLLQKNALRNVYGRADSLPRARDRAPTASPVADYFLGAEALAAGLAAALSSAMHFFM